MKDPCVGKGDGGGDLWMTPSPAASLLAAGLLARLTDVFRGTGHHEPCSDAAEMVLEAQGGLRTPLGNDGGALEGANGLNCVETRRGPFVGA